MLACAFVSGGVTQITGAGDKRPQNGVQLSGGMWVVRLVPGVFDSSFSRAIG